MPRYDLAIKTETMAAQTKLKEFNQQSRMELENSLLKENLTEYGIVKKSGQVMRSIRTNGMITQLVLGVRRS